MQVNDTAPQIPGHDYSNKWTLVYFYPKDFTPGCTTEACSFRDNFSKLNHLVTIIGISADSKSSHDKFKTDYELPFELVADTEKTIINSFGANGLILPKRVSFLINPEGKIAKIYDKVDVSKHASEIISDLTELNK